VTESHYWKARFGKGTPYVGVKTWYGPPIVDGEELDRSYRWNALVRNETTSRAVLFGDACPIEVDGLTLRNLESITEADWKFLTEHSAWATVHAPHLPDAAPTTAIDWNKVPPRW
jgi:hypothetical protein